MERFIRGTLENGSYGTLGKTHKIEAFLSQQGSVNNDTTIENTLAVLAPTFTLLAGYPYPANIDRNVPVAFCYAPMHLYKRANMPRNIKSFSAMSVSGLEHRSGRATWYSDTVFIAREDMHQATILADGTRLCYLDWIFGTVMTNWKDLGALRKQGKQVECPTVTEKVAVRIRPQDRPLVIAAVKTLYDNHPLALIPERDEVFNDRARELLIQIYSLLPPRFATEMGFACYRRAEDIAGLMADTSIRVFVLPEGERAKIPGGVRVFDLNDPGTIPPLQKEPETELLYLWTQLPWAERQQILQQLFKDTESTYMDKGIFYQRSRELFTDPLISWMQGKLERGSVKSLDELQAKYESSVLCSKYKLEWAKEKFKTLAPRFLHENTEEGKKLLDSLMDEALSEAYLAQTKKDGETMRKALDHAKFGFLLGAGSISNACGETSKKVGAFKEGEKTAALAEAETRRVSDVRAEQQKTAAAVSAGKEALQAEQQKHADELQVEQQKTADAIAAKESAVAAEKARGEAAVKRKEEEYREQIRLAELSAAEAKATKDSAVAEEKARGEAVLKEEREKHADAIRAEQQRTAAAVAAGEAAVREEQKNTDRVRAEGEEQLRQAREQSRHELEEERKRTDAERRNAERASDKLDETVRELEEQNEGKKKLEEQLRKTQKQLEEAGGPVTGKRVLMLILGLVLGLILGAGAMFGYWYFTQKPAEDALPTPTPAVTEAVETAEPSAIPEPTEALAPTEAPTEAPAETETGAGGEQPQQLQLDLEALRERVSAVGSLETEGLEGLALPQGYEARARIVLPAAPQDGEESENAAEQGNYLLLGTSSTMEAVESAEAPVMALRWDDYLLCAYGDESACRAAVQLVDLIAVPSGDVELILGERGGLQQGVALYLDGAWWRETQRLVADPALMSELLGVDVSSMPAAIYALLETTAGRILVVDGTDIDAATQVSYQLPGISRSELVDGCLYLLQTLN